MPVVPSTPYVAPKQKTLSAIEHQLSQLGLEQLVGVILQHQRLPDALQKVAIQELSKRCLQKEAMEPLFEAGGLGVLVNLIGNCKSFVQFHVLNALINISCFDQSQVDLEQAGLLPRLLPLLRDNNNEVINKALTILTNLMSTEFRCETASVLASDTDSLLLVK